MVKEEGKPIWLVKECEWAVVLFWPFKGPGEVGRVILERACGIQEWYVRSDGSGIDHKPLLSWTRIPVENR